MPRFLIDVNLPYRLKIWQSPDFIHQFDIDDAMSDSEIWEYARSHNLTIVSKDSDFSDRIFVKSPPPKVIHLRIGNLKFKQMEEFIARNWDTIRTLSENYKLITVYLDRIEVVS